MQVMVEHVGKLYLSKQVEVSLYKQAMSAEGNDAKLLLKTNIDDMLALMLENKSLIEKLEKLENKPIEPRYFDHHQISTESGD